MHKGSKPAVNGVKIRKQERETASTFQGAKAVAKAGLSNTNNYGRLVDTTLADYVIDTPHPDPRIIFSGVGKRIALANAELKAAALVSRGQKAKFFLPE